MPLMEKFSETVYEKTYVCNFADGPLFVSTHQGAGETLCTLRVCTKAGRFPHRWVLLAGTTPALDMRVEAANGVAELMGLPARGTALYWQLCDEGGAPLTDVCSVRAICRYPYGRTFEDNRAVLTQRWGQSPVISYDLEYYTTSDPLDGVRRRSFDTDPACYFEHILATILTPDLSEMDKAKAVWLFVGTALQHNGMHMNLRETVPAMDAFYADPDADADEVVMQLFELGHTRCGSINGFISAPLLKRIGIPNKVRFGCGGHTIGLAFIQGEWRLWDVDAFKGVIPLDDAGDIPSYDWVTQKENILLLDTLPSWEDTPEEGGWMAAADGHRITGYTDGARVHADTGFGSSWYGAEKSYPPHPPELLPVRRRTRDGALLEWFSSYDRDGDFSDYLVNVTDISGKELYSAQTKETSLWIDLPEGQEAFFTVEARDRHGAGTKYADRIYYTKRKPVPIPAQLVEKAAPYALLAEGDARMNYAAARAFVRIEGADNVLGQTRFAQTELFPIVVGETKKPLYRMVDETNYLFSGCRIRSLFTAPLQNPLANADGWHMTAVVRIRAYDFAGLEKFPLLWLGRRGSHIGAGFGLNCKTGLVHPACNIMGDWRYGAGFSPRDYMRLDVVCEKGQKRLRYYVDGILQHTDDYSMFQEGAFDMDALYLSGNPDAETGYLVFDLLV